MPIRAIERITNEQGEEIGIRLLGVGANGIIEVLYKDIPGNSWNQNRLNQFTQRAQNFIDQRIAKTSLSTDDPARLEDPARPDFFWDGNDLVARPILISNVSWDGNKLNFTLTRLGT